MYGARREVDGKIEFSNFLSGGFSHGQTMFVRRSLSVYPTCNTMSLLNREIEQIGVPFTPSPVETLDKFFTGWKKKKTLGFHYL